MKGTLVNPKTIDLNQTSSDFILLATVRLWGGCKHLVRHCSTHEQSPNSLNSKLNKRSNRVVGVRWRLTLLYSRDLNIFSPIALLNDQLMVYSCGSRNWINWYTRETIQIIVLWEQKTSLAASSQPARVCQLWGQPFRSRPPVTLGSRQKSLNLYTLSPD